MKNGEAGETPCPVCGKLYSEKENICPTCGSLREENEKRPPGLEIKVADKIIVFDSTAATLTHILIDAESGSSTVEATPIPSEVFNQEKEKRDSEATSLVFERNKDLEVFRDDIQKAIPAAFDGDEERSSFRKETKYVFNQCEIHGVVGGERHSIDIRFTDKWNQIKNQVDIEELAKELRILIEELKGMVSDSEHYKAVAEVIRAEDELKKANGSGMLQHLAKARSWVVKVAKKINLSLILQIYKAIAELSPDQPPSGLS